MVHIISHSILAIVIAFWVCVPSPQLSKIAKQLQNDSPENYFKLLSRAQLQREKISD